MLELLIVIRHGVYDHNERLSGLGKEQMLDLVGALGPLLAGRKTSLLTSTAPRARDSAEVLADGLSLDYEEHSLLWSDDEHYVDIAAALDLIERKGAEGYQVVILVTHLEYVEDLPPAFLAERFGGRSRLPAPSRGEALVIDLSGDEVATEILPN